MWSDMMNYCVQPPLKLFPKVVFWSDSAGWILKFWVNVQVDEFSKDAVDVEREQWSLQDRTALVFIDKSYD